MDSEDFRSILESAGVDVWALMDAAIAVASVDHPDELKRRRDRIVERLYASSALPQCRNCDPGAGEIRTQSSPSAEEEKDPYGGFMDEEQKKILYIKEQLEDPHQSEDSLVELLQNLADMDITFPALEESDIGRYVNRLRKHSSNDVKRLVKLLVRKWKEIVDEWVKLKSPGYPGTAVMADEDSPQQRILQNGHHQIPDFAYSPNPHSEYSISFQAFRLYFVDVVACLLLTQMGVLGHHSATILKQNENQKQFLAKKLPQNHRHQSLLLLLLLKTDREKAILTRIDLLQRENGFKRTTKRLQMPKSKERFK
ncbi:hypothetical protein AAZX31_05G175400 [Glycine max]